MIDRAAVLARHGDLEQLRRPEEAVWRENARVLAPDEQAIGGGEKPRNDPYADIFDASPLYALDSFAGGLFNQATNPTQDWFDLGYDDPGLKSWGPAREHVGAVRRVVVASLAPGASQFYVEAYPWFANTGAFGLSSLYDEPDFARGGFVERTIPLGELFIDVDGWGRVDTVHRAFRLRGRQARQRFGDLPNCRDESEYAFIHAVAPNEDVRPGRLGPEGMAFRSVYVSPDFRDFMRVGGYYELPYSTILWARRPGRVYPRGPGHFARADATMLQEMERSHLIGLQFRAEPAILTTEEAAITAADIRPNEVLYGAMSDQGKPLAQALSMGEDMSLSLQHAQAKREAIREAFLFSLMNLANRPQMTATEVLAFQEERLRLMAPNLVRVQEALSQFIARRVRQLDRLGLLPPPPPDLVGRDMSIEFVSPLAKAQKAATGRATMQWVGSLFQFAEAQPDALDAVDFDAVAQVTHDAYGPPPEVIRSPDAIKALREARAAQVQQQQQLEAAQAMAGVYAEVSHANQAQTRAAQRSRPS